MDWFSPLFCSMKASLSSRKHIESSTELFWTRRILLTYIDKAFADIKLKALMERSKWYERLNSWQNENRVSDNYVQNMVSLYKTQIFDKCYTWEDSHETEIDFQVMCNMCIGPHENHIWKTCHQTFIVPRNWYKVTLGCWGHKLMWVRTAQSGHLLQLFACLLWPRR